MKNSLTLLSVGVIAALLPSCGVQQDIRPDTLIVVKDTRIPDSEPWVARFARHSWVDYRPDVDSPWRRVEIVNESTGLLHHEISDGVAQEKKRWGRRVRVLSQSSGKENLHFTNDITEFVQSYDASVYRPWPGPNSNTFTEKMVRTVPGVVAQLDHNAIGKEHGFYAGRSAGGTGVELQSPLLGATIGLREGVEVNVAGFGAGVSLSPFAVKIPFLPQVPMR